MSNKNLKLVIYSVVLVLVLVLAGIVYNNISDNYTPENKVNSVENRNPAPDFTVYNEYLDEFSISSFKGKPVVVNFWTTWCGFCVEEFPYFEEAYEKYGDEVQFMMVNLTDNNSETVEKAAAFIEKYDYDFPVYYDIAFSAALTYDTSAVPVTLFIDENGNLVSHRVGMMTRKMLFDNILNLLGE